MGLGWHRFTVLLDMISYLLEHRRVFDADYHLDGSAELVVGIDVDIEHAF